MNCADFALDESAVTCLILFIHTTSPWAAPRFLGAGAEITAAHGLKMCPPSYQFSLNLEHHRKMICSPILTYPQTVWECAEKGRLSSSKLEGGRWDLGGHEVLP